MQARCPENFATHEKDANIENSEKRSREIHPCNIGNKTDCSAETIVMKFIKRTQYKRTANNATTCPAFQISVTNWADNRNVLGILQGFLPRENVVTR